MSGNDSIGQSSIFIGWKWKKSMNLMCVSEYFCRFRRQNFHFWTKSGNSGHSDNELFQHWNDLGQVRIFIMKRKTANFDL